MAPPLCNTIDASCVLLKPPPPHLLHKPAALHFPQLLPHSIFLKPQKSNTLAFPPKPSPRRKCHVVLASSAPASEIDIDMVQNKHGIFTSKQNKVVVLWDLDNKPPRGPPYPAAIALKTVAQKFGEVIEMSAYANRHAFNHLPQWVVQSRRERKQQDILERKGLAVPDQPYVCGVCGRKCKTNLDLKKHFKQLHERERQKKLNRMRSLKGKKKQRFKERFIVGNEKYNREARRLVVPKVGYGLEAELKRAGVYVKTVQDKPQAADWALKRQIEHSMNRGVDWLVLVTDDSDFRDILGRARQANVGTVVVGDMDRALGRNADYWVPWVGVENGEVSQMDLVPKRRERSDDYDEFRDDYVDDYYYDEEEEDEEVGLFSISYLDEGSDLEDGYGRVRISAFSEAEEEDDGDYWEWDSEDDEI
ncbi:hypothetical protein Tsubulata_040762 [Turnera subulata]|uniref:C2H2-type domain-containing protein n=1 Tax=Turnera subulata TaxID=218843 RepID=A0A9Q0FKJ0_9ROSI|nr:hypothetical protein Tsubulata_040762 [Turnera subulata]